jgi:small subunit ribosomal protein S16
VTTYNLPAYQLEVAVLAIRLTRKGARKQPFYRIVVAEKESRRDGRFVEIVGYYNPCRQPAELKLDRERISYWMARGAQPSDTVRDLIRKNDQQTAAA